MKNLNSNGLTIEQLEERMEFTAMAMDLAPDQITAARDAGYTDADFCSGDNSNCTVKLPDIHF